MHSTLRPAAPATPAALDPLGPTRVHRQVTFDLATFDHLKNWQRHLSAAHGRHLTNSEALRALILAHPAP